MELKWLLFDLGGVLVEYVGAQRIRAWMGESAQGVDLYSRWLFSPAVRAFESGRTGTEMFAREVIAELGMKVSPVEFLREFPDFVSGYYPGAEELLADLAARRPLAMLSNTNAPQWEKLCRVSGAERLFRKVFLSFRTGLLKPDPEAYRNVIEELGCDPDEILFFDDNPDNVRGAVEAGIRAVRVLGFDDMKEKIRELGLLA